MMGAAMLKHHQFVPSLWGGASAFNWWEENCCIFLKKISSPNAFYLFLPLFNHQTTPYNVLFFQKMKKYAFLFSFKQEQEVSGRGLTTTTKPHVRDVCNPDSLYTVFYLIYHFYHVYLCNKFYQTSPIYTLMSFSPKIPSPL